MQGDKQAWHNKMMCPPRPFASLETHGVQSYFSRFWFSLLKVLHVLSAGGASGQSSCHTAKCCLSGLGGTCLSQVGWRQWPAHMSVLFTVWKVIQYFCPTARESACFDSYRQQNSSSLHKSPRASVLSSASQNSQTAIALGAHMQQIEHSSLSVHGELFLLLPCSMLDC